MVEIVIVLPTYNEAENIVETVQGILGVAEDKGYDCCILVIDDNSPDGTGETAERLGEETGRVDVLRRTGRMGIGSAYIDGFKYVLEHWPTSRFIVQMDADGSHDPSYLPSLMEPLIDGRADVAVGSRYTGSGRWVGGVLRQLMSRGGNLVASLSTGLRIRDMTSGYRVVSLEVLRRVIDRMIYARHGYVFQVESLFLYASAGARIVEVPIVFKPRRRGKSKLGVKDIFSFLAWNMGLLYSRLSST